MNNNMLLTSEEQIELESFDTKKQAIEDAAREAFRNWEPQVGDKVKVSGAGGLWLILNIKPLTSGENNNDQKLLIEGLTSGLWKIKCKDEVLSVVRSSKKPPTSGTKDITQPCLVSQLHMLKGVTGSG